MEAFSPAAGQVLDGYRLVRFIGRGGFGDVWLCRSEAMGDYRAIKFISTTNPDLLEKEYESLLHYRKAAAMLRSPHLVPIEHINRNSAGLYYVMPLADGLTAQDPSDPAWQPLSLSSKIHAKAAKPQWFSSREITALLLPILQALQTLSEASLVHRDVKPDNILFFNGQPCLGDISLLGEDASVITRRGTPGYGTPSWYVGGHPDMYGIAATLYTLLTGNAADMMGRAAFLWPPQGERSLNDSERVEWKRLHAVIRRATDEKVGERFVDFAAMAAAVTSAADYERPPARHSAVPTVRKNHPAAWVVAAVLLLLAALGFKHLVLSPPAEPDRGSSTRPNNDAKSPPGKNRSNPANTPDARSTAYDDAQTAYDSLTWLVNDYYDMLSAQNDLYQDTLSQIQSHIWRKEAFDPQQAVRKLDLCLNAITGLRQIPNVMLARLLLLQASGDTVTVAREIGNPTFTTPGRDNLAYRVRLLCRLNAADKAEALLDRVLEGALTGAREKSETLTRRAGVKARLGKFADAHRDAVAALAVTQLDAALKAGVEMKLLELEGEYPGYAAYLKTLPEK